MKWVSIVLPFILAIGAYFYAPIVVWIDMNQGLLAFLGLLSAALIQVIPVTANFIQSDFLMPAEAESLCKQLLKQQRYWIGLLISTVLTFAIVVLISVLKDRTFWSFGRLGIFDVGPVFSAVLAFFLSFVLLKMTSIVGGVMSLQALRNELVLNAARRVADAQAKAAQERFVPPPINLPPGYGDITGPP